MATTSLVSGGPLHLDDPGAIAELRGVLRASGYEGERVREALGSSSELLSRPSDLPLYLRRLEGIEPLGTIVRLFVLDVPLPVDEVARAFAPLAPADLERLGLVALVDGEARPLARVVPHDELLVASDRVTSTPRPDHVAGVHGPSLTLANLTVRRPVESALDVGTGSGVQALLAARHSGRVVATDLNVRALNFAAFNAHLNGAENVELRAGSFFEPAAGERFGLVVCNPPYVISPDSEFLFRDSGMSGDDVSRHVVRRAGESLEEGGFAGMLVSWAHEPGAEWSEPLRSWLDGSGCDAWLLHNRTDDPLTHAANWTRNETRGDRDAFDAALGRWLAYCERLGIEGIAYGAVILRRRSGGPNFVLAHELPADRLGPAGAHVERVFAAGEYLSGGTSLLEGRFELAGPALLRQSVVLREGEWLVDGIGLSLEEGVGFRASVDGPTTALLAAFDGRRTLAEVAAGLAETEGASREAVEQAIAPVVRRMLEAGYLQPAEPRLH